jgi:subtilisin family serine protease
MVVYPHRVMTRRRRLRTRTLVLSLAAALVGAVVLPALGAPDPLQGELRSWDGVIGDGRSGESLPLQVIVVLAAPPAVSVDSPEASRIATATQQLDLDALARGGIWMSVQYRYVNALNAVSATVRPDQLAQLRAAPQVAGVYPVRKVYPAGTVATHLASLGAGARPLAGAAAGRGVSVALLDGPVDGKHPYLHQPAPGWNAINGKPQAAAADPVASAHGTAMAGIVVGRDGPAGLHGVAPQATLVPIQVLELQHGDLIGTTATLLAGLDRALDPNGDGDLSDRADVILAPVAEPFAAFGASAETIAAQGVERAGAVLVAAAGNDGSTGARFGTVASPAASPGWLAVGASDGRLTLPSTSVTLTTDGVATTIAGAPLAGGLKPAAGTALPLVLPAGPTQSDPARAPADIVAGTDESDFIVDGTSLVSGKAVLLPRDGATITQRAAAASAAGASALVLYGDGGAAAGALGLDDRVKLPIVVIPGEQGAAAAGTLLTGGAVTVTLGDSQPDFNPDTGSIAAFSSTGLAFDDSVKPDLVAPGVAVTSSSPGGEYMAQSGTSVAAAQVAGVAALVRQAHPTWSPRLVRGALVGSTKAVGGGEGDGPAAVEAQGGGAVDVAAATAATVVAEPTSLTFGLARATDVTVKRVLTLANTGTATVHVSVSLSRDGNGDDDSTIALEGAPSALAIGPGAAVPVPLTLKASGLPHESAVFGGWLLVAVAGGEAVRVPWALARSDDLAAGLIRDATLVPPLVQPTTDGNPASKLTLVLGSASSNGAARLEIAPVQRLSVDLYRDAQLIGRLVERHELLPGSYRYGITGIDPSTRKPLTPGIYRLVIDAVSTDDVTSERQLGFTVAG